MANPVGRPPLFSDPILMIDKFEEWKLEFAEGGSLVNDIPDIEGFCDYVGAWRDLLIEYEKKQEFSVTVKRIKNWIYQQKKQLALHNKLNAAVFIFDAKNNHGYVDKTEVDQNVSGELKTGEQDPETAAAFALFLKGKQKNA